MFEEFDVLNPGPPLDEKTIAAFEQRRERIFPASFRTFLLWRNGGVPRKKGWTIDIAGWMPLQWPAGSDDTDEYSDIREIWKIAPGSESFDHFDFVFDT